MTELTKIANECKTDKGTTWASAHGFTEFYDDIFRQKKPTILEIGVDKGASIEMYQKYYNGNCEIYAIDIEDKSEYSDENVHIFMGDQGNIEDLNKFKEIIGNVKFDIILDDGSHQSRDQIITLYHLHELLKPDGVYIIEDVHSNFNWYFVKEGEITLLEMLAYSIPTNVLTKEEYDKLIDNIKDYTIKFIPNKRDEMSAFRNCSITCVIKFKK